MGPARGQHHVGGRALEHLRGHHPRLARHLARGARHRRARVGGHPAAAGAVAVGQQRGVGRDHEHPLRIHAELGGRDLGHGGLVRLALRGDADVDVHGPGGVDAHVRALERAHAGALHVGREAHADRPRAPGRLDLAAAPVRVAEVGEEPVEGADVVGRVVGDRRAVAVDEAGAVRHLVGADHVAPPELRGIEAERAGAAIHQALQHEVGLGPARAPVRGAEHRVGDHVGRAHLDGRHPIRPGQVVDGVAGHHLAARDIGAVLAREVGSRAR